MARNDYKITDADRKKLAGAIAHPDQTIGRLRTLLRSIAAIRALEEGVSRRDRLREAAPTSGTLGERIVAVLRSEDNRPMTKTEIYERLGRNVAWRTFCGMVDTTLRKGGIVERSTRHAHLMYRVREGIEDRDLSMYDQQRKRRYDVEE
jgi:hypothetical protein